MLCVIWAQGWIYCHRESLKKEKKSICFQFCIHCTSSEPKWKWKPQQHFFYQFQLYQLHLVTTEGIWLPSIYSQLISWKQRAPLGSGVDIFVCLAHEESRDWNRNPWDSWAYFKALVVSRQAALPRVPEGSSPSGRVTRSCTKQSQWGVA